MNLPDNLSDLDQPAAYNPDDPLATIRAVEDVDPDKRVGEVGKAVQAIAAAGALDAITEEIVRDYVTRKKLLSRSAFKAIVKEARPYRFANRSHLHTSLPPAQTPANPECEGVACEPPDWARGRDILAKLATDLHTRCGLTGETRNAKLIYLVVASRVFDNPASAAVKGLSSAGKSYTVECVLKAFPPAAYFPMTAMSEHALVYLKDNLSHRTLVLYEATALREGREKNEGNQTAMFIRTLLSEGKIVYPVVVKDENGDLVTKVIEKEGPTNFLVTTTATKLHGENETRMLSLAADDSASQTKAVLKAVAEGKKRSDVDFSDWHLFDRWVGQSNHVVTVPYANWLAEAIPPVEVRLRRDFQTLLTLIRTHAMIHQLDRVTDDHGRIVATEGDYLSVRELVADLMSDAVGSTVKESVRQTVAAVESINVPAGVTVRQLADHLKIERSAAQYRVKAAREGGYIMNLEEKGNKPARYAIDAPLPEEVPLLPERLHSSHPHTQSDTAKPQVTTRCEGVNEQRRGEAEPSSSPKPVGTCAGCGNPMTILKPGQTRHPNPECDPDGEA